MYCNYTGNIHTTEEIRKMRITDFMEIQDQAISKMESEKKLKAKYTTDGSI
jgi:hypothetical protein